MKVGQCIANRYEIISYITEGGMGQLYKVRDLKLEGSLRALKLLKQNEQLKGNIALTEMKLLTQLNHHGLPKIYDYIDDHVTQQNFIIMEWINGSNLEAIVQQSGAFSSEQLITIATELIDAIVYLHNQQPPIVHRDIKPSNVMVDEYDRVKLIDFGISKQQIHLRSHATLAFGSPGFAAPEQMRNEATDQRSDIYSFGSLLYYLATGGNCFPYQQSELVEGIMKRELRHIPPALRNLITTCMQGNINNRFQSAYEVKASLALIGESSSIQARTPIRPLTTSRCNNQIAVMSLHSQAGSSTIALLLSQVLALKNNIQLMEYPSHTAMLETVPFLATGHAEQNATSSHYLRYYNVVHHERMQYCMYNSNTIVSNEQALQEFYSMVKEENATALKIIDFSSQWELEVITLALAYCDEVVLVCDPAMIMCNQLQLHKNQWLMRYLMEHQIKVNWIFNKDISFAGRKQWLSLKPNNFQAYSVPVVDAKELYTMAWSDKWMQLQQRGWKKVIKQLFPLTKGIAKRLIPLR